MVDTHLTDTEEQSAYSSAQKHALAATVTQGKRKRDGNMARQEEKIRLEEEGRERAAQPKLREQLVIVMLQCCDLSSFASCRFITTIRQR